MNKFYNLPKVVQWLIALVMFSFFLWLTVLWVDMSGWVQLMTIFVIIPITQFLGSPIFTLIGLYRYLSPMLLVYGATKEKYDVHNGTTFDYMMIMHGTSPGIKWQHKLLGYYLEGFLAIIQKIENGELPPEVNVTGSSYFFSERTAKRLGFEISKASWFVRFNLLLNYLDLFWMYSMANGKLRFPNLFNVKKASIKGSRLLENKERFIRLQQYLQRKQ